LGRVFYPGTTGTCRYLTGSARVSLSYGTIHLSHRRQYVLRSHLIDFNTYTVSTLSSH